jgi:acetyl esterase/lipase
MYPVCSILSRVGNSERPGALFRRPIGEAGRNEVKKRILALALLFGLAGGAHAAVWQPAPGHVQIPLWPAGAPHSLPVSGPEYMDSDPKSLIAGKPVIAIDRVSRPTLTVYRPKGRSSGAAVLVYPGGGFWILAIDLEGTDVCDWLTSRGITCVLVKYRVPGDKHYPRSGPYPVNPVALEDAQRAIALTRFHAKDWGIDPHKIGVLGFSAGGHLAAAASTNYDQRTYPHVDASDDASCRPDFTLLIYPAYLTVKEQGDKIAPELPITAKTPPTFIAMAMDDPIRVENAMFYALALKNVKVPCELHTYPTGGHGYGLRPTEQSVTTWPQRAGEWLGKLGVLAKK